MSVSLTVRVSSLPEAPVALSGVKGSRSDVQSPRLDDVRSHVRLMAFPPFTVNWFVTAKGVARTKCDVACSFINTAFALECLSIGICVGDYARCGGDVVCRCLRHSHAFVDNYKTVGVEPVESLIVECGGALHTVRAGLSVWSAGVEVDRCEVVASVEGISTDGINTCEGD